MVDEEQAAPDENPGNPEDVLAAGIAACGLPAAPADGTVSTAQMATMTQLVVQAMAALTPSMFGVNNGVTAALTALVTAAQPFNGDGRASWADWIRLLINRMRALHIPHENWVPIVLSLLTGAASAYALSNGITDATTWDLFIATMAAGPWASNDTFFSLLYRLTRGNLGNGNAQETVSQIEKIKAKLGFVLPFQFWIFILLVNLHAAFRESLLVGPDGNDWISYEELRKVVLGKAAAMKSANSTNGNTGKNTTPKDTKNVSWKDALTGKQAGGRSTAKPHHGDPGGASSSTPNAHKKRKQNDNPTCFGCGSTTHKIADRNPNGTPVCPIYDEEKMRRGKYHKYPKPPPGNGKGKA
jgi:hypothetical protein